METLAVWRPCGAWAGRRAVLYEDQDGDEPVACGNSDRGGYEYADVGVGTPPRTFEAKCSKETGYGVNETGLTVRFS